MSIRNQPDNQNFLQPTAFQFVLNRTPETVYFCRSVNVPGITFGEILRPTNGLVDIKVPGDSFRYDDLTLSFLINEDLGNWKEIHDWMRSMASVEKHEGETSMKNNYSDATLMLLSSNYNPTFKFDFIDCFPKSLSSIDFDTSLNDVNPINAVVTFGFNYYTIENLLDPFDKEIQVNYNTK